MKFAAVFLVAIVVLAAVVVGAVLMRQERKSRQTELSKFKMTIDDVFAIKTPGRAVVVGVVSDGVVRPGDTLYVKTGRGRVQVSVESLEAYYKPIDIAKAGDRVGIMLVGVDKGQVAPKSVLSGSGEDE